MNAMLSMSNWLTSVLIFTTEYIKTVKVVAGVGAIGHSALVDMSTRLLGHLPTHPPIGWVWLEPSSALTDILLHSIHFQVIQPPAVRASLILRAQYYCYIRYENNTGHDAAIFTGSDKRIYTSEEHVSKFYFTLIQWNRGTAGHDRTHHFQTTTRMITLNKSYLNCCCWCCCYTTRSLIYLNIYVPCVASTAFKYSNVLLLPTIEMEIYCADHLISIVFELS